MNRPSLSASSGRPMQRGWRILMWVLVALIVLFVAAYLAIGAIAANRLTLPKRVFSPDKTPATYNLPYEDVRFQSRAGDVELAGWFIPSADNARAIVLVHGRNGSRTANFQERFPELAAALHKAGFAVFMFDLRGHGQSGPGRFTFGLKERQDALAAVDWLRARGFQPGRIGMLGISLGAAASVGAAAEEPAIGALVTDSGFADIRPLVEARWAEESGLPQFFLRSATFMIRVMYGSNIMSARPVEEITKVPPRPVMFIHSQIDDTIPIVHLEQLRAAVPTAQVWVTPSGDHAEIYNAFTSDYEAKVSAFFAASLK